MSLKPVWRLLRHPISQNIVALSWLQIATFLIPLVTLPYVARVLHPSGFGLVVFAQGFSFVLLLIVSWGFTPFAVREVAAERHHPDALGNLAAWVRSGQLVLSLTAALVALAVVLVVPKLHDHPHFLALAWVAALGTGLTPTWYFLGVERLRLVSLIQLGFRVGAAALTFLLVKDAGDAWIVLGLYAASSMGMWIVSDILMYREVPFRLPSLGAAVDGLRRTAYLFAGLAGAMFYTSFNVVLLGLFVPSAQVAHFGAAERVLRVSLQVLAPIAIAVYPRFAYLQASQQRDRARHLFLVMVAAVASGGLVIAGLLALFAPLGIRIIFGSEFVDESVPILRILVLLIPMNITAVLAAGWLLSVHMEKLVARVVLMAGILNVVLGSILTPLFGPKGMACSVVVAELAGAAGAAVMLRRARRGAETPPGSRSTPRAGVEARVPEPNAR